MDGVLVIDKPAGLTSHDVVASVRRLLRERRVGHTGTLDPMATGVLPLVIGRATRLARFLTGSRKRYSATIVLGIETDTFDAEGTPVGGLRLTEPGAPLPSETDVREAVTRFRDGYAQVPPAYSAKKVSGVAAYRLARRGSPVETLPPVDVTAYELTVEAFDGQRLGVTMEVSAGFYVRSLAQDIGRALGCGAHLGALRRTASGEFDLGSALALEGLDARSAEERALPMESLLAWMPAVRLTEAGAVRASHGNSLQPGDAARDERPAGGGITGFARLLTPAGRLLAIAETAAGAPPWPLHPSVVLT